MDDEFCREVNLKRLHVCTMKFNCVERRVANLLGEYARFVSKHPLPFIALPVLITMILSMGFVRHRVIKDDLTLYTPTNAQARHELKRLERYFRIDDSDPYYAMRRFVSFKTSRHFLNGELRKRSFARVFINNKNCFACC